MLLEIDLYRSSEEKTLLHFLDQWGDYKIIRSDERQNRVGGKYRHYEINFNGISHQDMSKLKKCLKDYEIEHPGVWDTPEE